MSRQGFRKLAANGAILIALSVCLFFVSSPRKAAALLWLSRQKTITKYEHRKMPLSFDKVKAAGRALELRPGSESQEDFEGDDDWMKDLAVTFKNTSDKNVVYFRLDLQFPETEATGPMMTGALIFGRRPKDSGDRSYDKILKPGEEVEITLTGDQHDKLRSFLKTRSFDKVSEVRLFLETAIFDDDLMWNGGDLYKRDQNNPNNWLPIR